MAFHKAVALPTSTRINPDKPETAEYYDPAQVHYIVEVDGKPRDFTSYGSFTDWAIGDHVRFTHDQTCRELAYAVIVGIRTAAPDAEQFGSVPSKSMPHWVAK